jgi:hypothetical protein
LCAVCRFRLFALLGVNTSLPVDVSARSFGSKSIDPFCCVWRNFNETGNRLDWNTMSGHIHWHTYMATFVSDRRIIFIVTVWLNFGTISCLMPMIHKSQRGDPLGAWVNGFWH